MKKRSSGWYYGGLGWHPAGIVVELPKSSTRETRRDEQYFKIVRKLNDENRQGMRALFDCGDLGFALIYWRKSWEVEWFNEMEKVE